MSYPDSAGSCTPGTSFGPHGMSSGSLSDGNIQFNNRDTGNSIILHSFDIVSSNFVLSRASEFKGFLIRVQGKDNLNIGSVISSASSNTQLMPTTRTSCPNGVEAITHVSNSLKSSIEFAMHFTEPGDYVLQVVVMVSRNEWYSTSHDLSVSDLVSAAPSMSPSASSSPTTEDHTSSPTLIDTMSPSGSPSNDTHYYASYSQMWRIASTLFLVSTIAYIIL